MYITELRTNHLRNPIGYALSPLLFSWTYEMPEEPIESARIILSRNPDFTDICYDSGFTSSVSSTGTSIEIEPIPHQRIFWKVNVKLTSGKIISSQDLAFFEWGKVNEPFIGKWICVEDRTADQYEIQGKQPSPVIIRDFSCKNHVRSARLYITGLGLYECSINECLINDGFFQPGFNTYNQWLQYQTFDVSAYLRQGINRLSVLLGAGWYKGRFGVGGGFVNQFGRDYHLLYELHIQYSDASEEIIFSDGTESYLDGPIKYSGIYDGEDYDATISLNGPGYPVLLKHPENIGKLMDRYSLPVVVKEILHPQKILTDADGNTIIDFGQNLTGWVVFRDLLSFGEQVHIQYSEHLEKGRFYRNNLHSARAEFNYTGIGSGKIVRPHFTYNGFRYAKIDGFRGDPEQYEFQAYSLYSDMDTTGFLETGNSDINRLIQNALWSQKDNFVENPSDCPQRDERLGWTGDVQIYCRTASYFMDTMAFYRKYMKDVNETQKQKNGCVPFIIPQVKGRGFDDVSSDKREEDVTLSSAAWSDVATILPWSLYLYYGYKGLLKEEYAGMKAWVDYIHSIDLADGNHHLWKTGFHFGDWLAIDDPKGSPFGLTDKYYIASCYYYLSTCLLYKAAEVLGNAQDAHTYRSLSKEIHRAILQNYFDKDQICTQQTQTGYILAIYMNLVSPEAIRKNGQKLLQSIRENGGRLNTGFVGTPYICIALSQAGLTHAAYDLLLQEDYPSWLSQVRLGATTIWEAWTALDEQGNMNGDSSLNHYAFGSIVEWLYAYALGIRPSEEAPGFQIAQIEPHFDRRLGFMKGDLKTVSGIYHIEWNYLTNTEIEVCISVPFMASAYLRFPGETTVRKLGYGKHVFHVTDVEEN